MKRNLGLLTAAGAALAALGVYAAAQESAPRRRTGDVGRYQLANSEGGRIVVLDTTSGQCWSKAHGGEWRDEGNPTAPGEGKPDRKALRTPIALKLPEKSVEMTVLQREERAIPGSDGRVRIQLGDITDNQAFLTIVTDDGEKLLDRTSLTQGDKASFAVGEKKFTAHIKELRNILIGNDFAKISISAEEERKPARERDRSPEQ